MIRRTTIAPLILLLSSACAVGPDYVRPQANVPAAWKEKVPSTGAETGTWKVAQPKDGTPRGAWWQLFGDPALNALETRVTVSNQSLAQAEAQLRGARASARLARSALFPIVSAAGSAARAQSPKGAVTPGVPAPTASAYQLLGEAAWEPDLFGGIRRGLESSVANAEASAAQLEAVRLSLHAELASSYFALRGVDEERRLLESTVAAYQTALELTRNRYRQGVVSGVDVAQAQTQLETTRALLTDLGIARAQLEHALAVLVGTPPSDFSIPSEAVRSEPPVVPLALPSELLERRPDVAASERHVAAANAQIGVAKAAYFPTLSLSASGGYQGSTLTSFFSLPNRVWSLGSALLETVFDGGRRKAASEAARASWEASVAAYRENVLTAFQEVEDGLAALRILAEEQAQQAEAVAASEHLLSLAKNRYQGGVTSYLEVVTAQSSALANERTAVDLRTRRMTATVSLIKALGGGWQAGELPTPKDLLEPVPAAAQVSTAR